MTEHYDVVVIGAGIHGAGVAQAAAAKGYSVLVLEQFAEAAQGTSSRSSKLIHGGLRYLETGEFRLVRECLHERKLLIRNAPELVHWRKFYIPIYKSSSHSAWKIFLGLALYSLLAGFGKYSRFCRLPKSQWASLDGLKTEGLRTVFQYWDAQTDDAQLTKAVLKSAVSLGATITYKASFESAERKQQAYQLLYTINQEQNKCSASVVVNASGPWVDKVCAKIVSTHAKPDIDLVQGTHILLADVALSGIYYLEASADGRTVFVMPWNGMTMIGTTEINYLGDPALVKPQDSEIHYLLDIYNYYFPGAMGKKAISQQDILKSFAGLRVLPSSKGAYSKRSRETLLISDNSPLPKLVSIYGGKLTSYRATAEKVIKLIKSSLASRPLKGDTADINLIL